VAASAEQSMLDLAANPVFAVLPGRAVRELARHVLDRKYVKGRVLYQAADPPAFLILVRSGLVALTDMDDHGQMHPIQTYSRGDLFGLATVVLHVPRRFTAYALTDVEAILIPQQVFSDVYAEHPAMAYEVVRLLGAMLCRAQETSGTLTRTPIASRIARFLLHAATKTDRADAARSALDITLSRNDLAIMVGTSRETVTRVLSRLSRAGLITMPGRRILIKSPERLRRFADEDGRDDHAARPETD
jgi:CRP-like cAMP-binding protein